MNGDLWLNWQLLGVKNGATNNWDPFFPSFHADFIFTELTRSTAFSRNWLSCTLIKRFVVRIYGLSKYVTKSILQVCLHSLRERPSVTAIFCNKFYFNSLDALLQMQKKSKSCSVLSWTQLLTLIELELDFGVKVHWCIGKNIGHVIEILLLILPPDTMDQHFSKLKVDSDCFLVTYSMQYIYLLFF